MVSSTFLDGAKLSRLKQLTNLLEKQKESSAQWSIRKRTSCSFQKWCNWKSQSKEWYWWRASLALTVVRIVLTSSNAVMWGDKKSGIFTPEDWTDVNAKDVSWQLSPCRQFQDNWNVWLGANPIWKIYTGKCVCRENTSQLNTNFRTLNISHTGWLRK